MEAGKEVREVGVEEMMVSRSLWSFQSSCKHVGFYSEWSGATLDDFEQSSDLVLLML